MSVSKQNAHAVEALGALAHDYRLAVFRMLVTRGPDGLPAGAIAERLDIPPSSLTFHVQALTRAGLIRQRRDGRQLIYSADFDAMNDLMGFLTENCCRDSRLDCSEVCVSTPARQQARKRKRA